MTPHRARPRLALALALTLLVALAACGTGAPDHVRIGLVVPLSGPRAYFGQEVRNGVELAIEDLNDDGGLLGARVELVVRDDSDLVDLPADLADLAERARVSAVIGPETSGVLLGPRSPLSRRDVPALLPTAFAGDLDESSATVLRTVPSAHDQAAALARWLTGVRAIDDVAVLIADPAEGATAEKSVLAGLADGGATVAAVVTATGDPSDLRPQVEALRRAAPDAGAVLLWAPPPAAARATTALRALRWDVQVAVPASAFIGEYRTLAGEDSDGVVLPFPFREEWFTGRMENWLLRYYRDHGLGALPDLETLVLDLPVAALAGYDAVHVVAEAVRLAGTREPVEVAAALPEVEHDGLLRPYRFDEREAWAEDDLYIARFLSYAVIYDADPRLDPERQVRFYDYQVGARFLPAEVLEGPAGDLIAALIEERQANAPPYEPPRPPPGPV